MLKKSLIFMCLMFSVLVFPGKSYSLEWFDNIIGNLEENLDEGSFAGLGVMYSSSPYKSYDDIILPVPIVNVGYKGFFIDQKLLGYNAINQENFKGAVVIGPHFGGYDASESGDFVGMDDRDWGFDAGVRVKGKNEIVDFSATALIDVSGTYEGQELSFFLSKALFEGFLRPRVGTTWSSKDAVDYYFGVKPAEARAGRPAYHPDATMNHSVGLTVAYPLGDQWAVMGDIQYQFFGKEIAHSPIVDEDEEGILRLVFGTVYRF